MKTNKNGVKLLAAVMVFAMAFAGAFVLIGNDSDAAENAEGVVTVDANSVEEGAITTIADALEVSGVSKIVLKSNITEDVVITGTIEIDLNGYKITNSSGNTITVENGANLTISDSSTEKEGVVDNISDKKAAVSVDVGGTAILNGGSFDRSKEDGTENSNTWYTLFNHGTMTINAGVAVTQDGNYSSMVENGWYDGKQNITETPSVMTINGGTFTGGLNTIKNDDYGQLTINSGTFTNTTQATVLNWNVATINGGIFNSSGAGVLNGKLDNTMDKGELAINGGTFTVGAEKGSVQLMTNNSNTNIGNVIFKDGLENVNVTIPGNQKVEGTITFGNNSVSFNMTTGTNGMTFSQGSVFISGDIAESEDGKIVVVKGNAKLNGNIPENTTVTVNNGATLEIPKDATVKNNGTIVNNGTLINNGTLTNESTGDIQINGTYSGTYKISNSGTVSIPAGSNPEDFVTTGGTGTIDTVTSDSDNLGMKGLLGSDYTANNNEYLVGTLTVPEGVTLTVNSIFDLKGENLVIEGKLVITSKGSIVGALSDGETPEIILSQTGSIENKGLIGNNSYVTVTDGADASVKMKNVKGVEFALTKEIVEKVPEYTLTVSGTASKSGSDYCLEIDGAYITDLEIRDLAKKVADSVGGEDTYYVTIDATVLKSGSLTVASKAAVENMIVTFQNGAVLTIDGEVATGTVTMYNGSVANINGDAGEVEFQANTGAYKTYNEDGSRFNIDKSGTKSSTIKIGNLKGVVIDVTSRTYTEDKSGQDDSRTLQMMNVSGAPDFVVKSNDATGSITVTGEVYIAAGKKLVLAEEMSIATAETTDKVITEGTIEITDQDGPFNYVGASYDKKVPKETSGNYTISYYTSFDDAYANIASAENMKITIKGDYTFTKSYTVAADQEIKFETAEIAVDGKIIVEADGTLSSTFAQKGIKGVLVVMDGASCRPVTGSYEVSSKDADNNYTYTSAERAIADAAEGDIIYITDDVVFSKNTTVPAGVTVDIAAGSAVTANKDLTVNGKIVNNGTVDVKGNLAVNGEVDNNNAFSVADGKEATVKGTYTGTLTAETINAAKYSGEEDVYTTVAGAFEATSEMEVPANISVVGKVTESSEVVFADGQTLTIDGTVVLKSIRLVVNSKLIINDTLTADVIGATGTADTTGALADTIVSLKEVKGAQFDMKMNESTSTTTMYLDKTTAGTTTVSAGSVESKMAITVSKDNVVKVSSGAELVVKNNLGGAAKYFTNEGTLKVADNMEITGLNLAGNVVVAKGKTLTVNNVVITGTIETAENATVKVTEKMYIGSKPTTLGASASIKADVTFGTDAYVVVFDGSSFENTSQTEMDSTAYTINGIAFATVYISEGDNVNIAVVNSIVNRLKDLDIPYTDANNDKKLDLGEETYGWKSGSNVAATVGQFDSVDAKIDYAGVNVVISVGPGMIVYIDDLKVTDDSKNLLIGEHTVTVYLEPDYTGTAAISFNGASVSNGKIVVTADMIGKDPMLVVTGATPAEPTAPVTPGTSSGSDGMSITDYLLIVLVVLIVIMAVLVAIRMMRS